MRTRTLIAVTSGLIVVITAGTAGAVGHVHSSRFNEAAAHLQAAWDTDQQQGVPAASLKPLRDKLATERPPADWWAPVWVQSDDVALIDNLRSSTDVAWAGAMAAARQQAKAAQAEWTAFAAQQATWIGNDVTTLTGLWPAELAKAATPLELTTMASDWTAFTEQQRKAVAAAQLAKLNADLAAAGGPAVLLTTAHNLLTTAATANLDDAGVTALASNLQQLLDQGLDPTTTAQQLLLAVDKLQALVSLNNQVNAQVHPLMLIVDQAAAEGTPNGAAFNSQFQSIATAFRAARTNDQITLIAAQISTEQAQVNAELAANTCGHTAVGDGKVITVSLTLQEMIFYQDGCVVQAAPTTTGRPALATPTGTFHIFYKTAPFEMISPWPKTSPFYYNPSWVKWVMEFNYGGYFIHDAYWEAEGDYGPGSQFNPNAASHGCIHIPTTTMEWAYSWTPSGTPVIINA